MLPRFRGFIFDLDGVIRLGDTPVRGAAELISLLRKRGIAVCFLTNNATKSRADYARLLGGFGISTNPDEFVTSAYGSALYLKQKYGSGRCFIIGEAGLERELSGAGFKVLRGREGERADFVVVGLDRKINYGKIRTAYRALRNGARFIAANTDSVFMAEDGPSPGGGVMVALLEECSKMKPEVVIGKPNPLLVRMALKKMGLKAGEVAIVGDVLETDILAGNRMGIFTILVLTGKAKRADAKKAGKAMRPKLVLKSVREIGKLIS